MICTTIQNKNIEEIFDLLDTLPIEMAEIRLDRCNLSQEDIEELFSSCDVPLVATCRVSEVPPSVAESRLLTAIRSGAAYADLEMEAPAMMSKRIRREAQECGTLLIRSFHDYTGTDSAAALSALVEKCRHLGADIVKIATTAHSYADVDKVLSLYGGFEPGTLIAFCMGDEGRESRIDCLAKGAPFSYACTDSSDAAAPGQWTILEMTDRVYGGRRFVGYDRMNGGGPLKMPSSKSYAQRAIILAALSEGESHLRHYTKCSDNESAIALAKELGAEVSMNGRTLTIKGRGIAPISQKTIHTGESGFLTRLMIPVIAALGDGNVLVTGEKTLLERPLKGAKEIMEAFGVELKCEGEEVHIPLEVSGHLRGGVDGAVAVDGKDGSQIISGLLAALPLLSEDTTFIVRNPKSIPYIYITLEILKKFGVRIENEMEGGEEFFETQDWNLCEAITFHIKGKQHYKAVDVELEADWSSAANFLVAGAVFGFTELAGLDTKSLQADLGIMDILTDAGASLSQFEDSGVIHVQRAPLRALDIDASNCPDLFPILAVLAAFCEGRNVISGVGRLRSKESDRGQAILEMLLRMGVKASVKGDRLIVEGHSLATRILGGKLLKGGNFTSHHDHRMVMALRVAELGADSPIVIDDVECVAKSFPEFETVFASL